MAESAVCAADGLVESTLHHRISSTYIFETVQILIAFTTNIALVRLLLFHTKGSRVWRGSLWVHDRESSITVLMQLLSLMTMRFVIPKSWSDHVAFHNHQRTYLRPFWFLYAFSQPMTGQRNGLCSSPGIIIPALPKPCICIICC